MPPSPSSPLMMRGRPAPDPAASGRVRLFCLSFRIPDPDRCRGNSRSKVFAHELVAFAGRLLEPGDIRTLDHPATIANEPA